MATNQIPLQADMDDGLSVSLSKRIDAASARTGCQWTGQRNFLSIMALVSRETIPLAFPCQVKRFDSSRGRAPTMTHELNRDGGQQKTGTDPGFKDAGTASW
ncbi:hypothetical protein ACWDSL_24010 [Streptomyces sp. NPDC000941]